MVFFSKTPTHQKGLSQEAEAKALYDSCQVGRQVGLHLGYPASEPRERAPSYRGESRPGQRPRGGPTYGCTCELRREKGNPLTPSIAQAGAWFRASSPAPAPALQAEGSSIVMRVLAELRVEDTGTNDRDRGPDLAAASGGGKGRLEPRARPPVRAGAGRAQPRRPLGPRAPRRREGHGPQEAPIRGDQGRSGATTTTALPLASQSAQYLLSSSLSSLDRMSWCCSFSF